MGWFAGVDRNLTTFLEGDRLAVRPLHRFTVGGALHLTGEGVGHPGVGHRLGLMVPHLLGVLTDDLRDDELHVLLDELALLPGHGLAGVSPGPDLLAVLVSLPVGDTV